MLKSEKTKVLACVLTLIPVIAMMFFIYCMSAQNSEKSSATSGRVTKIVVRVIHPDYDELPEAQQKTIFSNVSFWVRKTAHFTEYAALAFFSVTHAYAISGKRRISVPAAVAFSALYACFDEWHQSFVAGRGPSIRDVGIDTGGAVLGALIMFLILTVLLKKSKIGKIFDF